MWFLYFKGDDNIGKNNGKTVNCGYCKKEIYRTQYRLNKNDKHFCSNDCSAKYRHEMTNELRKCEFCKTEFKCLKTSSKRFCSNSCVNKYIGSIHCGENHPNFNSTIKQCEVCSIDYLVSNYKIKTSKYCSDLCRRKAATLNGTFSVNCSQCNKEINVQNCKAGALNYFCCKQCETIFRTGKYRNNNITKEDRTLECKWCKNKYEVIPSRIAISKFCSRDCQRKYHKNVLYKSEEYKNKRREISANTVAKMKSSLTKPHLIIDKLLKENNIEFVDEKILSYYSIDIFLDKYKIPIEIQGDFWHCNPLKYSKPSYDKQRSTIKRDRAKNTFLNTYYKLNILYLWEKDIYEDLSKCLLLINECINNNGVLANYHSFNYSIVDNKIKLNSKLVETF